MKYRVLVLGGYGIFGQRIAQRIAQRNNMHVIIAGRNLDKATVFLETLRMQQSAATVSTQHCDVRDADSLARAIHESQCDLVINTCGPFQARDYTCPLTVIKNGVHYIDLADAREYVCGFHKLDELAKRYGVLALTGASSVPALSSAVIDVLKNDFEHVHSIDIGINPGNQTPRGIATVRSILSYCGKPFLTWRDGQWKYVTGWQNLSRRKYPQPMGKRWLSHCDIPDLSLFQQRYPGVKNIHFQSGLELSVLHLGTWLMSWFSHWGWINDVAKYAAGLKRISERFYRFGSTIGGMHVELEGIDQQQQHLRKTWYLIAGNGDGPQVPCTAAVILADKFQQRALTQAGAFACMGFISLQEFEHEFQHYAISVQSDNTVTPARAAEKQLSLLPIRKLQQSPPGTTPSSANNAPTQ